MALFRPSREHHGPDPYYHWKTIVFAIGAAFGLAGIFTDHDWDDRFRVRFDSIMQRHNPDAGNVTRPR